MALSLDRSITAGPFRISLERHFQAFAFEESFLFRDYEWQACAAGLGRDPETDTILRAYFLRCRRQQDK